MATVTPESERTRLLENLVHLDYDAIDAYSVAIDRVGDPTATTKLREFREDHERHVQELSELIVQRGGRPPKRGDYRRILTRGRVYLASTSGINAILRAMQTNLRETTAAYARALDACADAEPEVQETLRRGLEDERRHLAWMESQLR